MLQVIVNPLIEELHCLHTVRHLMVSESAESVPGALRQGDQITSLLPRQEPYGPFPADVDLPHPVNGPDWKPNDRSSTPKRNVR
jgi:hypothetical protein